MAGHGHGQGGGHGHGQGQGHGQGGQGHGQGGGFDDAAPTPVGKDQDDVLDTGDGPGRSENSPGHLKKAAGAQSARDFAPGRARRP